MAEAVHRDVLQRLAQPATALLFRHSPQHLPGPGCGLEGQLDEIMSQRLVPAGQRAGVTEQAAGVGPEAQVQFLGCIR